jgi:hypothetical protein
MACQTIMGAVCTCTFGAAPSSLMVLPTNMVNAGNLPAATIMDYVPMLNVLPFGVCTSLANPTVAAATAAALGVLTPMPCIPMTVAPWITGNPVVLIKGMPALNSSSTLMCMWGGSISQTTPGQFTVMD